MGTPACLPLKAYPAIIAAAVKETQHIQNRDVAFPKQAVLIRRQTVFDLCHADKRSEGIVAFGRKLTLPIGMVQIPEGSNWRMGSLRHGFRNLYPCRKPIMCFQQNSHRAIGLCVLAQRIQIVCQPLHRSVTGAVFENTSAENTNKRCTQFCGEVNRGARFRVSSSSFLRVGESGGRVHGTDFQARVSECVLCRGRARGLEKCGDWTRSRSGPRPRSSTPS